MINSFMTEFQNDTESGCGFHIRVWSLYLYSLQSTYTLFISALMLHPYLVGFHTWRLYLLYWCTIIYSALATLGQVTFHIIWGIEGKGWIVAHSWWAKLVGFARYLNERICSC
jgi:hypothetical protein